MAKERQELQQQLTQCLESALNRLDDIWDKIGIVNEHRNERIKDISTHLVSFLNKSVQEVKLDFGILQVVMLHLSNLMDEMVKEETALEMKLMKTVEKYGQELLHLCKELRLPPHQPPEDLSILRLEKELRTHVEALTKEKHERLVRLKKLKERDQHLCDILCTTPYYIPSGAIPTKEQLKELEKHVQELKEEQEKRTHIFQSTKKDIMKLIEELEHCPDTSFERDIVCEEEDSFLLSTENMKAMKKFHEQLESRQKQNFALAAKLRDRVSQLWNRLQISQEERNNFNTVHSGFRPTALQALREEISRCELLKLQNVKQVIEDTREELKQWWDKCFYSQEQRNAFKAFTDDNYSEDLLEAHDQEVRLVRAYYEENKEMLENVARRQKLFDEFLEFERKTSDPNRFFSRGYSSVNEQKTRKKLEQGLPKVEQEVAEQISIWEKSNRKKFAVNGVPFMDFVKSQWEEYRLQKEQEKQNRIQQKAKQTEEEMLYGSKPIATTPGKRRFMGTALTPGKTPSKLRKLNSTQKTPSSISRIGSRLVDHTNVYSPACMAPRSASRSTSKVVKMGAQRLLEGRGAKSRRALAETNNTATFSQTTVSSGLSAVNSSAASVASVGPYHEFAKALNSEARTNSRSSVLTEPGAAYF